MRRLAAIGVLAMTASAWGAISNEAAKAAVDKLVALHGEGQRARIERGVAQAGRLFRSEDGDFVAIASEHFVADPATLDATFAHLEKAFEMVDGHFVSIGRELRWNMDIETGPILAVDRLMSEWDPSAHLSEDLFRSKLAFAVLLNFPDSTLQERLEKGPSWTRRQWAEARLAGRFDARIPPDVLQAFSAAAAEADAYIAGYNLHLHHALTRDGKRVFPEGLRLITHWGLRDEIKAHYGEKDGVVKQRVVAEAMDAIVRQTIPKAVIDHAGIDWIPATSQVVAAKDAAASEREADARYAVILKVFQAARAIDPYTPSHPDAIRRSFEREREIPLERVRAMFEGLFKTPTAKRVASLIEKRLGRPLEPFDIWYAGFKPRAAYSEADLDAKTKARYPTSEAFAKDLPRILRDLGFDAETATYVSQHVAVDASRGAGHALGAGRRDDLAHLRTRVGPGGMDYKGYNIAVHEFGHNVEQVFSLNKIDHTLLAGVPANAFTEALAFVFQARDLQLLGLPGPGPEAESYDALETFWSTCEIGAVALVDVAMWEWMYAHPNATPAELRAATVAIAEDVWARTFGPLMGGKKSALLGIYSHILSYPLYVANYPIGHLIAFQLEEHFRGKALAKEFERVCRLGRLTPDLWMQQAVGAPIGIEPLVRATEKALGEVGKK